MQKKLKVLLNIRICTLCFAKGNFGLFFELCVLKKESRYINPINIKHTLYSIKKLLLSTDWF